jgi:dienelactone hydrolase
MVAKRVEALASMKLVYIDAGKSDEWYLDLGAQAFAKELDKAGIGYSLDLFDAGHMGIQFRYPRALEALARALAPES